MARTRLYHIDKDTWNRQRSESGKAIYFTYTFDRVWTGNNDRRVWFPLSQIKLVEDFNDVGWGVIEIPEWLIRTNCLEKAMFVDIQED